MKAKVLLLDCGGVMIYPPTGDWTLTEDMREILGEDFFEKHLEEYRRVRKPFDYLIPDSHRIEDETAERALMECFYRRVFGAMGRAYTDAQYDRLTLSQAQAGKYGLFDDVKAALARWQGQIALGIVSDAPPSTRTILREAGVLQYIDGFTFSFQVGCCKPEKAIYQRTLDLLGVAAADAVFVDDVIGNLRGAQALGMRCIQMRRNMPERYRTDAQWDGPVAHDFAELEALL